MTTGCHRCKFKASVDAGLFKNTPWEKVPCTSCDVMSGMGFSLEYDPEHPEPQRGPEWWPGDLEEEQEEEPVMMPVDVMSQALTGFMNLKAELRDVVAWRYAGLTYPEIAERQGVTVACVEKRHRRAMEIWPALKEMFPEKVAKQKRRKPHVKKRSPAADHSRGNSEMAPGQRKSLRGATEVLAALGFSGGLQ